MKITITVESLRNGFIVSSASVHGRGEQNAYVPDSLALAKEMSDRACREMIADEEWQKSISSEGHGYLRGEGVKFEIAGYGQQAARARSGCLNGEAESS